MGKRNWAYLICLTTRSSCVKSVNYVVQNSCLRYGTMCGSGIGSISSVNSVIHVSHNWCLRHGIMRGSGIAWAVF